MIQGIIDADDRFNKIKAIIKACYEAGIDDLPKEVEEYLEGTDYEGMDNKYILKEMKDGFLCDMPEEALIHEDENNRTGPIFIDLSKISKKFSKIKVWVSY